ncbi:MAG TPA: hypothetical protein VKK31_28855 [Thermoanaerobaculia bacterium]|nr:hypothetical protein [Thermoanaerobaculia bacterium]
MERKTPQILGALALSFLLAGPALAQHEHHQPQEPEPKPEDHSMHDMQGKQEDHSMHDMHEMPGLLGPYGMSREASGTAWQPDSAPHMGIHTNRGPWDLMVHGFATLIYDDQDGPRGDQKTFSENMLMGMASRPLGPGRLGLRTMLSAEPLTIGKEGYPLLFQTGETANGVDPLVDRQHPHDLFMELSASYSLPLGEKDSAFVYLGLPGEPALGPATFMHRFSGMENPEAPLSHHWLDSTHITYGVATLGWIRNNVKLEGSVFTGREPDENRDGIESPKMDSWSLRASWNPSPDWSFQVSRGHLKGPEQLEPETDLDRTTASAAYNRPLANGNWQTTLAWGRNDRDGTATDALLLESAATCRRHTLFGRAERLENDELFGHGHEGEVPDDDHGQEGSEGEAFTVGKISLGYIYDAILGDRWRGGIGLLGSVALVPEDLKTVYGDTPVSWMAFLRVKI